MAWSEYADWWDKQKLETEKILGEWVQDNPQWWAVAVATGVQTSMDLGGGYVDVLRFGEGIAEGGLAGVGKDALRLLAILGPLGKGGGMLSRLIHTQAIRLAVQVKGVTGPCTFQAVNNVVAITRGKTYFITLDEMAAAAGRAVGSLGRNEKGVPILAMSVEKGLQFLTAQGAKITRLNQAQTIRDIVRAAETQDGVVVFAIRCWVKTAKGEMLEVKHTVLAVRDVFGRVRFSDYKGKYFTTLEDLVRRWGRLQTPMGLMEGQSVGLVNTLGPSAVMENMLALVPGAAMLIAGVTAIETSEGVDFAVPVVVAATSVPSRRDPAPPEIVKSSFKVYRERRQGKTVIRLPEIAIKAGEKAAPKPEYLTGVQFRLNALGFGAGRVDGIKGPKTAKAVKLFQKAYPPLKVDGVPGPKTQEKLVEICGF